MTSLKDMGVRHPQGVTEPAQPVVPAQQPLVGEQQEASVLLVQALPPHVVEDLRLLALGPGPGGRPAGRGFTPPQLSPLAHPPSPPLPPLPPLPLPPPLLPALTAGPPLAVLVQEPGHVLQPLERPGDGRQGHPPALGGLGLR